MNELYKASAILSPVSTDLISGGIDTVKDLIELARDIAVSRKVEETKRVAIRANAQIAIEQIKANNSKELLKLRNSHDERMKTIFIVGEALKHPEVAKSPELIAAYTTLLKEMHVGESYE